MNDENNKLYWLRGGMLVGTLLGMAIIGLLVSITDGTFVDKILFISIIILMLLSYGILTRILKKEEKGDEKV